MARDSQVGAVRDRRDNLSRVVPLRNRVTPLSELVAVPERGLVHGNRGCLHDGSRRIRRHHATRRWIACRLEFKGWQRSPLMQPGRYTELFFLDDATALAAGHRPCALCRRADYTRLVGGWRELHPGPVSADAIDARLHEERFDVATRRQRHHAAVVDDLPDGAFVLEDDLPWLVLGPRFLRWTVAGYVESRARPVGRSVTLITPPSLVALLRSGWEPLVPFLHPSAAQARTSRRRT